MSTDVQNTLFYLKYLCFRFVILLLSSFLCLPKVAGDKMFDLKNVKLRQRHSYLFKKIFWIWFEISFRIDADIKCS